MGILSSEVARTMNVRRILILSITALTAGLAGYSLLGMRAPKQTTPVQTAATGYGDGTVIAVGPDGTLYTLAAPGTGYGTTTPQSSSRRDGREREEYDGGYAYPYQHE